MPDWIWYPWEGRDGGHLDGQWKQDGPPEQWEVDRRTRIDQTKPGATGERRTNDDSNRIVQ